jgi:polysaccharide biosynthesis protein PslH
VDVLVVTNLLPSGRRSGGEIVTQSVVDALFDAGHEVRVLGYRRPQDGHPPARGEHPVGTRPPETGAAGPRALAWGARALAARAPYSTAKWHSRAYVRALRDALAERPDAAIVDHAGVHSVAGAAIEAGVPFAFVAHNAEGEMYASLAAAAGGAAGRRVYAREARLIRGVEAELAGRARQVWTLAAGDARYMRGLAPGADLRLLAVASALREPAAPAEPVYDVALIGTWTWHANAHGLRWFADEVLPALDGLSVHVAGRGADWLRRRDGRVTVRGVVPDAAAFMARARVVAVPSTAGGGVQVKTLDAVACGLPVVATGTAARGLDGLPDSVAVADAPEEFARELRRLAAEPARERLRDAGVAWSRARRERLASDVAAWTAELR